MKTGFTGTRHGLTELQALLFEGLVRGEAFHHGGTWYTIRYAKKQGKKVTIIWPDGSLS